MGCDIHGWVEVNHNGRWIGTCQFSNLADNRNYERFARLAGVRGEGPEPKGFPADASESAYYHYESWGADAHSASHMAIEEALPIFMETEHHEPGQTKFGAGYGYWKFFDISNYDEPGVLARYRIVFWFDN